MTSKEALSYDTSGKLPDVRRKVKAKAVYEGSAAGVVVGENMGGGRLEGKRKGHVYETGVWHFKLSVLEVERHTHAHTCTYIHADTC